MAQGVIQQRLIITPTCIMYLLLEELNNVAIKPDSNADFIRDTGAIRSANALPLTVLSD